MKKPDVKASKTPPITARIIAAGIAAIDHFTISPTIEPNGMSKSVITTGWLCGGAGAARGTAPLNSCFPHEQKRESGVFMAPHDLH
jgi:hypothetical protein